MSCVHNCIRIVFIVWNGSSLYSQVQAVTTVGAGNFSPPVIVELDGLSEDSDGSSEGSNSSSVVGIVVAVVIILLSVVGVLLAVCMYITWWVVAIYWLMQAWKPMYVQSSVCMCMYSEGYCTWCRKVPMAFVWHSADYYKKGLCFIMEPTRVLRQHSTRFFNSRAFQEGYGKRNMNQFKAVSFSLLVSVFA